MYSWHAKIIYSTYSKISYTQLCCKTYFFAVNKFVFRIIGIILIFRCDSKKVFLQFT